MSNAVVEVVLGLVFVFFLFSMLCSGINEMISRMMGKRADFLTLGVWRLLEHSGTDKLERARYFTRFWQHPLVRTLGQPAPDKADRPDQVGPPEPAAGQTTEPDGLEAATPGMRASFVEKWTGLCTWTRGRLTTRRMKAAMQTMPYEPRALEGGRLRPSYIPAETFATVVIDLIREDEAAARKAPASDEGGEGPVPASSAESPLARAVTALAAGTNDEAQRLRASLERWYDAQMERVSGWYKRESKRMLLWLGALVVLALNVDTISIARTLWSDPSTRRAVAAAADRQLAAVGATTTVPSAGGTTSVPSAGGTTSVPAPALVCPDSGATTGTAAATGADGYREAVAQALHCARSLPLPIGWRVADQCGPAGTERSCDFDDRVSHAWDSFWAAWPGGWLLKVVGWGLTIGALSFGAPFWFDLLNRFGSLRGSGAKPKGTGEA